MWVKIIRGCADLGFGYMAGPSGRDLPMEVAQKLIKHNRAVPIKDPNPKEEVKEKQKEVKTAVVTQARKRPVKKDEV